MGQPDYRPDLSLDLFHFLFNQAHWDQVLPDDASLADSENSLPEACYRIHRFSQTVEVSYHEPLDQVVLSVNHTGKEPDFKLFFFLGKKGATLIKTLTNMVPNHVIGLRDLNAVLVHTEPYCQFTLLELPGEGLFDVGPQKAKA